MIKDIIQDLRMCFGTDPGFCDCDKCHHKKGCIDELGIAAADALEKLCNFADNYCMRCDESRTWIPVTERLPEGKEGNYLVATKTPRGIQVHEALFFKPFDDYIWLDPVEEFQEYHVTHWMPLPQKPWKEQIDES